MDEDVGSDPVVRKQMKESFTDTEIQQFYFQNYFMRHPETEDEKTMTAGELLSIVKSYYEKCNELVKSIVEGSLLVQQARKKFQWCRVLNTDLTIEDLTFVAETFLLEYEMSEKDHKKQTEKCETDPNESKESVDEKETLDTSKNADIPDQDKSQTPDSTPQNVTSRTKEECIEKLLGLYYHANIIEKEFLRNSRQSKVKNKSNTEEMEATDDAVQNEEKLAVVSDTRLEFIRTFKLLIRSTLMLFKKANPIWLKMAEEVAVKYRSQENKRKLFSKSKSASTKSSEDCPSSSISSSSSFDSLSKQEVSDQSSKE